MDITGHRIARAEFEPALVSHPAVAEAAVVGANDATTGQAIVAFVTVKGANDAEGEGGGGPPPRRGGAGGALRRRAAGPCGPRDRPDRQAAPDHVDTRAAQDPQRQDHAPPPARR